MKGLAFACIVSLAMALSGCGHCFDLRPHGSYKSCQDDGAK
ncbi:hypothetical protein [Alsobacter soli]|nr:hypothetical protein [Alsobacter soli]